MRIGIHTSIANSLEFAALKAHELGANCFQIFSASPRMWRALDPDPLDVERLKASRKRFDLYPLAIHGSYLINLAAADETIRTKSIAGFRAELERALAIGAEYVVAHPGSYKGQTLDSGIATLADSLTAAAAGLRTDGVMLLLENTAGSGATIGGKLSELTQIRDLARRRCGLEVGYCLDTAHLLAAGYDITNAAGIDAALGEIDTDLVRVIHSNDSRTGLGSHVDRHEHIGKGHIGTAGFRCILSHPVLKTKAFILETPIDQEGDDLRNMRRLKRLSRPVARSRRAEIH